MSTKRGQGVTDSDAFEGAQQVDVAELKRTEEALRQSEKRFKRLFEAGIIGIFITDFYGKIHEANDAFLQMIGYSRDEVLSGQVDWHSLTPPEYLEMEARFALKMIETG